MKKRITLTTLTDCQKLADICSTMPSTIELFSPKERYRCSAKSLLGCLTAIEWQDLWIECGEEIEDHLVELITDFFVSEEDGNFIHD